MGIYLVLYKVEATSISTRRWKTYRNSSHICVTFESVSLCAYTSSPLTKSCPRAEITCSGFKTTFSVHLQKALLEAATLRRQQSQKSLKEVSGEEGLAQYRENPRT
jgi:hypothetical protein